jgi:hypothetical protein
MLGPLGPPGRGALVGVGLAVRVVGLRTRSADYLAQAIPRSSAAS